VRAARLHEIGGTPRVDELDEPRGDLVLKVTASALNPVDIALGNGSFYGGTPETPYVIGSEALGRMPDGRRVWYHARGVMAERVGVTAAEHAVDVPDGVGDALALACGIAGLTGWLAVSWRARVTPDDTVLVLGASGTLGATAVQGAKLLGAKRVVGAARRTENIPAAADEVVGIDGSERYPEATVIVDGLWGRPIERALAGAATGVRVVQLGQSAGPTATLESGGVRGKAANILGHSLFSVPVDTLTAGYRELAEHARAGNIQFQIETYELDQIAEAWKRQSSGSPGTKIVVSLDLDGDRLP
jgi:NADPH:quinone reductase-like Zn-dependent oxidoreductase